MVVIIVDKISPRIEYTLKQVFQLFIGVPYKIVETSPTINEEKSFLINYSSIENSISHLHIIPNGLLNENKINAITPDFSNTNDEVKLFQNDSAQFGFDVFAAIFWLISRYEEYTNNAPDSHNRFTAKNSFAFKNKFLSVPVVDIWTQKIGELINAKLPAFVPKKQFSITNTIDVDNAFAYKGKDFVRRLGAFSRDLMKGKLAENIRRKDVLSGKEKDPYDTYDYIKEQTISKKIKTKFFHLVGEKSKHDRNIKVDSVEYIELLKELDQWSDQGLHPSYLSNSIEGRVRDEKSWLEKSLNKTVTSSRQHFLILHFPKTYNSLIEAGIKDDFTLGFADEIGFRAGTARSFYFFDLITNQEKELMIHPFCLMDGTLRDYMKLNTAQAKQCVEQMELQLKKHNLPYVSIWHNETLSETNGWEGWREVYEAQFR